MSSESKRERSLLLNEAKNSNIVGVGLSARPLHYSHLLKKKRVPWLEFLGDNYLHSHSIQRKKLHQMASLYPLVFHCIGFNLGSMESCRQDYLAKIKSLVEEFRPMWVSDHLCFCGYNGHYSPDLLPIPHTQDMLEHVQKKLEIIINTLKVPFLVENVSAYIRFEDSSLSEEEFLKKLTEVDGCGILLDVNNLYVNSQNHGFDPFEAFLKLPVDKICQIHIAGYKNCHTHLLDTHSENIHPSVLALFQKIIKELGPVPVTLERDDNIPPFEDAMEELELINTYYG